MYESPINVYIEQAVKNIEEQRDNEICHYITEKFNVNVDREELIRALNYDRGQYEKGYRDAQMEYEQKMQEMIAEIENRKESLEYTLSILEKGDAMEGKLQGAKEAVEEIIEIVNKYCDKEQINGKGNQISDR